MARPKTKSALIDASKHAYQVLITLIESLPTNIQEEVFSFDISKEKGAHWTRDHNIRDVLIHLYEWQQLLIKWVEANHGGENKPFLPQPYSWKDYAGMNQGFWEKHQSTTVQEARDLLQSSHQAVLTMIEAHTDEELFTKAYYPWTGSTSLGAYCISSTSSHYEWATKKIKKHKKASV